MAYEWSAIITAAISFLFAFMLGCVLSAILILQTRIARVKDHITALETSKTQAEAAHVAMSQVLHTVSHETRRSTIKILGMLTLLGETSLTEKQRDYAQSAQSCVMLTNEFLDRAEMEAHKLELKAVRFDVRSFFDDVLSFFPEKCRRTGVELAVFVSEQVPEMLVGDPGRFRQVITNLVGNSIKFTEEGHIHIKVNLAEEEDDDDDEDVSLRVSVEDTGIGIPVAVQERIFAPFMQAESSTSIHYGGTGLGLSISKAIVKLMGGRINLISHPKIGTTFTITLLFKKC